MAPRPELRRVAASLSLAFLSVVGCDDPTTAMPRAARLGVADPLPTFSFVGRTLTPTVRVLDASNHPVAGVTVRFASARGTTTLQSASAVTDARGIAAPGAWTLPTTPSVDTLVASIDGVAPLRIPMSVRAGPVARWEPLAPATGAGVVQQSLFSGPVFQAFDRYGNPVANAKFRVETTPAEGGARTPVTILTDANGVGSIAEWVPRVLGTHTLRFVEADADGNASPSLTREVREPDCAPSMLVPRDMGLVVSGIAEPLLGALATDAQAPCADRQDRWAIGVDSMRGYSFGVHEVGTGRPVAFSIVRAGTSGAEGIVLPAGAPYAGRATEQDVLLPKGDYELVVGPDDVATPTQYRIDWYDHGAAPFGILPVYTVRGVSATFLGTDDFHLSEAAVDGQGQQFVVSMRDPARRRIQVRADALGDWSPVIALYARRGPATTATFLAVERGQGRRRTLVVDVPAEYEEALVYVLMPFPLPQGFTMWYTVRID